jgi:hypothetical protein
VCLDSTKGYGEIVELEAKCDASEKERTLTMLRERLARLDVKETSRETFEEKFKYYKKNWKKLLEA